MDIDTARLRATRIDKGFEYYKLYLVEKEQSAVKDSINFQLNEVLKGKDFQLATQRQITLKAEKQSRNNLSLARRWKKKARSPKGWIVPGLVGLILGYGLGR
jgi:hypothetical protein